MSAVSFGSKALPHSFIAQPPEAAPVHRPHSAGEVGSPILAFTQQSQPLASLHEWWRFTNLVYLPLPVRWLKSLDSEALDVFCEC